MKSGGAISARLDAPRAMRPRRWLGWRAPSTIALYFGTSAFLYRHVLARLTSSLLDPADPVLFVWWMRWIPFAVAHGHNALEPKWTNYPFGVNAMWNVSAPLLGLIGAPLTLTAGPVATVNVLFALGPPLSALAAYFVLRRYTRNWFPSVIGGLAYGFAPYFAAHGGGHLPLVWGIFPPLLIVFLDEIIVRQRYSPVLMGTLLGAACLAQLLLAAEVLALGFMVAGIAVVVMALSARDQIRRRAPYVVKATAMAVALVLVAGAWPLWVLLFGANRPHGLIQTPSDFVADGLSFVVPTKIMPVSTSPLYALSHRFTTPPVDETSYIGLPLLLLVAWFAIWKRRDRLTRVLALTGLAAAVLSLGSTLHVGGRAVGRSFLPWRVVEAIPILKNALAVRLSQYVALVVAALVALALDAFMHVDSRRRWLGCAAVAIALVPLVPRSYGVADLPETPPLFTDSALIPAHSVVILEPYPTYPTFMSPLLWQARAGMRFLVPSGLAFTSVTHKAQGGVVFASFDSQPTRLWRVSRELAVGHTPNLTPRLRSHLLSEIARLHASMVVVAPNPYEESMLSFFESLLSARAERLGGVWVFRLDGRTASG